MTQLNWENKYSVGIKEIDKQHKELFILLNNIRKAIDEGRTFSILSECMQKLDDYAAYHFKMEEQYMAENKYPHLEEHKVLHQEFITKINNFKLFLDPEKHLSAFNILEFLINWISFHILESDKEYAHYIQVRK